MEKKPHELALDKAKIGLMARKDSAFFTTLAFNLKMSFSETNPTASTNGTHIEFGTAFFMALDPEERIFLLLHEAMHCAYLHMIRQGKRNHSKFNIACDHVINLQLIERGFKMPKNGYADPEYKGLSAEEVYDLLPEMPPDAPVKGFGSDLQAPGAEGTQSPDQASEALAKEMENILVMAATQSALSGDKPGTIPGEIELFVQGLLNPKLPWNRILQKYVNTFSKEDYTFKKPNRRFLPKHYLPSLHGETLMKIAAFADISASVTDAEFHQQLSEVAFIFRKLKPKSIMFGQFDTQIKQVDEIKNLQELMDIHFTGRGGTQIAPVLHWANANKPQFLLVFTDGHFRWPVGLHTDVPIIWLIYNNPMFTAPIGKVIHYSI